MHIRPATEEDQDAIWALIGPVIQAGETYALDRDLPRAKALAYWLGSDRETFVAVSDNRVVGTYYLRVNQPGGGNHVANCGYISGEGGKGVARAMHAHSIAWARARGFRAMQYNFVVSSNQRAVQLWQSLGFDIVGRLPGAFHHPRLGYVDALVMYRTL